MAKSRIVFVCRGCGSVQQRWIGKCPDCGAWGSLEQERVDRSATRDPQRGLIEAWQGAVASGAPLSEIDAASAGATDGAVVADSAPGGARPISEVSASIADDRRIRTSISELDRVLGGGLVRGSVVLVGGDPGIGKSTLMLQAAGQIARQRERERARGHALAPVHDAQQADGSHACHASVLYVSSEESAEQVRMRAARLGIADERGLFVLADTNLARIVEQVRRHLPSVVVIDSVQMVYKADLDASPGSVAQLRRCCAELVYLAKVSGIAVVLVGHVTKDGQLAGPRLLEHLVDAVLYFEGDRYHAHRVLRAVKNRFGTTLEIGVFEMTGSGLTEAVLGGAAFLESLGGSGENGGNPRPKVGSVICPVMTGTRCMLSEVQALTATSFLGSAKRKSSGLDANRLAMLIAVLEQHAELRLADRDVFASSAAGIRVVEPAADLAVLLAIAGAHFKRALPLGTAMMGEVGLGGEVRSVTQVETRVSEAARLGCSRIIVPMSQLKTARAALAAARRSMERAKAAAGSDDPKLNHAPAGASEEGSAPTVGTSRRSPAYRSGGRLLASPRAAGQPETGASRAGTPADADAVATAPALARSATHAELKPNAERGEQPARGVVAADVARVLRCEILGVRTINEAIAELA